MSRGGVGHLSMQLDDETYISFWPNRDCTTSVSSMKNKTHSLSPSYSVDVREEGREADDSLTVASHMVDQVKIRNWWNSNKSDAYNLFKNNCALAVKNALKAGGFCYQHKNGLMVPDTGITPYSVFCWVRNCMKDCYRD